MNREKNYEKSLPEGYREMRVIDAKSKKLGLWMNGAAIAILLAVLIPAWRFLGISIADIMETESYWLRYAIWIGSMLAYIVLHELVHGLAYKLLTGRKLTFGLTLTVAYCGVPDIYVYRKTALISLLAPFTVFSVVFLGLFFGAMDPMLRLLAAFLLGMHWGGCMGDLYDTFLFLTKHKKPSTLMRDTGPTQWIYEKETTR